MKTIKQHEDINLHIKKSFFYGILRSIFVIPLAVFLISSFLPIMNNDCYYVNCMNWYDWGMTLNFVFLTLIILIVSAKIIVHGSVFLTLRED